MHIEDTLRRLNFFLSHLRLTKYDRFNVGDAGESPTNQSYRMNGFRKLFEKKSIKSMLIEGGSKKYAIGGKTTNGMPV